MLEVEARHRLGQFQLDATFASAGPVTALFGPSGAGKTSLIKIIAGLIRPDAARISIGGRVLADTGRGIFVPPHRRRIGYVFQEPRLFPHLTVAQNLKYGAWFTPRRERQADFGQIADLLGLVPLLQRLPANLSGGEQQRAAIGRALLSSPALLLMDEPLASLDAARKAEILPYIERLTAELRLPVVYVSHALAEIARLAHDIALMEAGRVVLCRPAAEALLALGQPAPPTPETQRCPPSA